MKTDKKILDACCGSRMMWFDKYCSEALFMDIRREELIACDGRHIKVDPDIVGDFRAMPFDDESFRLVVLDPPHLRKLGGTSGWLRNTECFFLLGKRIYVLLSMNVCGS